MGCGSSADEVQHLSSQKTKTTTNSGDDDDHFDESAAIPSSSLGDSSRGVGAAMNHITIGGSNTSSPPRDHPDHHQQSISFMSTSNYNNGNNTVNDSFNLAHFSPVGSVNQTTGSTLHHSDVLAILGGKAGDGDIGGASNSAARSSQSLSNSSPRWNNNNNSGGRGAAAGGASFLEIPTAGGRSHNTSFSAQSSQITDDLFTSEAFGGGSTSQVGAGMSFRSSASGVSENASSGINYFNVKAGSSTGSPRIASTKAPSTNNHKGSRISRSPFESPNVSSSSYQALTAQRSGRSGGGIGVMMRKIEDHEVGEEDERDKSSSRSPPAQPLHHPRAETQNYNSDPESERNSMTDGEEEDSDDHTSCSDDMFDNSSETGSTHGYDQSEGGDTTLSLRSQNSGFSLTSGGGGTRNRSGGGQKSHNNSHYFLSIDDDENPLGVSGEVVKARSTMASSSPSRGGGASENGSSTRSLGGVSFPDLPATPPTSTTAIKPSTSSNNHNPLATNSHHHLKKGGGCGDDDDADSIVSASSSTAGGRKRKTKKSKKFIFSEASPIGSPQQGKNSASLSTSNNNNSFGSPLNTSLSPRKPPAGSSSSSNKSKKGKKSLFNRGLGVASPTTELGFDQSVEASSSFAPLVDSESRGGRRKHKRKKQDGEQPQAEEVGAENKREVAATFERQQRRRESELIVLNSVVPPQSPPPPLVSPGKQMQSPAPLSGFTVQPSPSSSSPRPHHHTTTEHGNDGPPPALARGNPLEGSSTIGGTTTTTTTTTANSSLYQHQQQQHHDDSYLSINSRFGNMTNTTTTTTTTNDNSTIGGAGGTHPSSSSQYSSINEKSSFGGMVSITPTATHIPVPPPGGDTTLGMTGSGGSGAGTLAEQQFFQALHGEPDHSDCEDEDTSFSNQLGGPSFSLSFVPGESNNLPTLSSLSAHPQQQHQAQVIERLRESLHKHSPTFMGPAVSKVRNCLPVCTLDQSFSRDCLAQYLGMYGDKKNRKNLQVLEAREQRRLEMAFQDGCTPAFGLGLPWPVKRPKKTTTTAGGSASRGHHQQQQQQSGIYSNHDNSNSSSNKRTPTLRSSGSGGALVLRRGSRESVASSSVRSARSAERRNDENETTTENFFLPPAELVGGDVGGGGRSVVSGGEGSVSTTSPRSMPVDGGNVTTITPPTVPMVSSSAAYTGRRSPQTTRSIGNGSFGGENVSSSSTNMVRTPTAISNSSGGGRTPGREHHQQVQQPQQLQPLFSPSPPSTATAAAGGGGGGGILKKVQEEVTYRTLESIHDNPYPSSSSESKETQKLRLKLTKERTAVLIKELNALLALGKLDLLLEKLSGSQKALKAAGRHKLSSTFLMAEILVTELIFLGGCLDPSDYLALLHSDSYYQPRLSGEEKKLLPAGGHPFYQEFVAHKAELLAEERLQEQERQLRLKEGGEDAKTKSTHPNTNTQPQQLMNDLLIKSSAADLTLYDFLDQHLLDTISYCLAVSQELCSVVKKK